MDEGDSMTVLKQHHAPGMPAEVYDQVAAGALPSQSEADGFVAHYAIVEDGGITVIEIWESIDQHDAWFNEVVKPHLPPGTPEPRFAELHNSNTK
jgi:heme-degrading monooxygenase HmoA